MTDATTTIELLDWCRWFLLAQAGFVGAASIVIWVKYALKVLQESAQPRLWHIVLISSSYICGTAIIADVMWERIGQPFSWRLPAIGYFFVAGDAGLCFMLAHIYSHRVYAKGLRERLIQQEIDVTLANTAATNKNTEALGK